MYSDNESLKLFKRMHARDVLAREAHQIGRHHDILAEEPDIFDAHAETGVKSGWILQAAVFFAVGLLFLGLYGLFSLLDF
jgi:hypothetical protein